MGPDGSSYHYGGRFLHLGAVTTQGKSSQVFHCHCIHPCTNFTSVFRAKRRLPSHSASEVADQSQVSGCLVTSGRCWPSAADEEWYSPKRPSSTVAVNELNTKVSHFSLVFSFQLDGTPSISLSCGRSSEEYFQILAEQVAKCGGFGILGS